MSNRISHHLPPVRAILIFLILFSVPMLPSARAEQTGRKAPLSEAQLLHLLPVLRAYAASLRQAAPPDSLSGDRSISSRVNLITEIKEGRVDPQEWLQGQSDYAFVPPMLEYNDRCSRLASELSMRPCAVYTFGIEASELGSALLADDRKEIQRVLSAGQDQSDAQQRVNAAVANARAFYQRKKFGDFQHDSPLSWTVVSPDSLLQVSVIEANVYIPWGGTGMPSGPILELSWYKAPEESADRLDTALAQSLPSLLKKAKVTESDFLAFTTALVLARADVLNPGKLEIDPKYVPSTEDEKRLLEDLKGIVAVRKQNMALYLRYARTLDPLLDIFEEQ